MDKEQQDEFNMSVMERVAVLEIKHKNLHNDLMQLIKEVGSVRRVLWAIVGVLLLSVDLHNLESLLKLFIGLK